MGRNTRRRRVFLGAVGLALTVGVVLATAQQGDILILEGERYTIHTNPLEQWLEEHPDQRPTSDIVSSSLWRGYVATWEVLDGRLCLTDVAVMRRKPEVAQFERESNSVMSEVFPGQQRVPANWYSGHIIVPRGRLIEYVHQGYASTFESYIVLRVNQGVVEKQTRMDAAEFASFRKSQFRSYQKTEEYGTKLKELLDLGDADREVESFLFAFLAERYLSLIFEPEH